MAEMIRLVTISSRELVAAHLAHIESSHSSLNAVTAVLADSAMKAAEEADEKRVRGEFSGPLHGVPFSVKDSIDVQDVRTTAGTLGRRTAPVAKNDATLVARLRAAGGIPIAKTNLPDLLFSFETDNLIYGRTNNPFDTRRTPGGSSGGEAALIASGGSPFGLGSDALGSVRVPAAFCGISSIKPTSGRLPRTGHVPPAGGWMEGIWQIGPMARHAEDLELAMRLLAHPDGEDFTSPPAPLFETSEVRTLRAAFFTSNGFVRCTSEIEETIVRCANFLSSIGLAVEECRPQGVEDVYELELALLGADGAQGIDSYLEEAGSRTVHPFLTAFLSHMRPHATSASGLARRWAQWDQYRHDIGRFFDRYDVLLCPVYSQPALRHGESTQPQNFEGFSYTMAWSTAGTPAATVRCGEHNGLPINVQVVAAPWRDMTALTVCRALEREFGGWQPPAAVLTSDRNEEHVNR
jgi:amidase